jgi:glutathione peroxidase
MRLMIVILSLLTLLLHAEAKGDAMSLYDFKATRIDGREVPLSDYRGKVLLIVNTASKCGFTPQYEGLEKLYQRYGEKGFMILGFPSNQFGAQEPGSNAEIANFCRVNYGVSFDMFAKIDVNGDNTHPLYKYLKKEATGLLGSEVIKWNFTKFLIGRDGKVIDRYAPATKPESIAKAIEKLL